MKKEKVTVQALNSQSYPGDNKSLWAIAIIGLVALFGIYYNHFDNAFHFDDSHTIVENIYIRDIKKNAKLYFTDARTITPLTANQMYRPVIPFSYGVDYWVSYQLGKGLGDELEAMEKAGKMNTPEYKALVDKAVASPYITRKNDQPKPLTFHWSNFFWYLVQGVLMYFFIARLFALSGEGRYMRFFAMFATFLYMFHTINAETINYVCARSDSYSTMLVVMAFVVYQYWPSGRKYFLYLIPMILGILAKASALMFAPLLIVYVVLIEQQISLTDILKSTTWQKIFKPAVLLPTVISFVFTILAYALVMHKTPKTYMPSVLTVGQYITTEVYVAFLYFIEFFAPIHLSADSDMLAFPKSDPRFFVGLLFILALLGGSFLLTKRKELRPIAFGLFWYFLALLPSSSIQPFAEVLNDHRMYFPNIGLAISVVWVLYLLFKKYEQKILDSGAMKGILTTLAVLVIAGYGYGTYQRNIVWDNDESLWYDVTVKSPKNGRGLMNYALTQYNKSFEYSAKGDKATAIQYLNNAIKYYNMGLKYNPYYTYLHINIALAYDALGLQEGNPAKYYKDIDDHFKLGQKYAGNFYGGYYFYANWLWKQGRKEEAIWNAEQAVNLGPDYEATYTTVMGFYFAEYQWDKMKNMAQRMLQRFPGNQYADYYLKASQNRKTKVDELQALVKTSPTPENFLNLSLEYYNAGNYEGCISAAEDALIARPNYAAAYNNICSAYNALGKFDLAIEACNKALKASPDYALAQGNLNYAVSQKKQGTDLAAKNSAVDYLNAGLAYHRQKQYNLAIDMYNKSLEINPNFALAFNNLCSAYNDLGQYAKAIPYGEKAVKLDPANQLFKNNLSIAQKGR
jgi:tetratricopeptide (TPR) repeat protein